MAKKNEPQDAIDVFKFEEMVNLWAEDGRRVARMPFRPGEAVEIMKREGVNFVTVKSVDETDTRRVGVIDLREPTGTELMVPPAEIL